MQCAAGVVFFDGPARGDGDKQALVGRGEHAAHRENRMEDVGGSHGR